MTIEELRNRLLRSRARTRRDAITTYDFPMVFELAVKSENRKIRVLGPEAGSRILDSGQ